ncbi:ABC transporter substrate-binding protein [Aeromicrobium endophyticum]|uniref:Iron ABC transporter substrate-binding protein n=1 Tax=Aeromicrobium endophyticum TaxID=2292704 RepID=A0A371P3Q9_9ACTN|nr:ABC transporter substrate-binding protein [Aeromicrobium endophyticum]REK70198.1 iron ABC transporter substrate-binding protein [Aeromicrobium endophyticum]
MTSSRRTAMPPAVLAVATLLLSACAGAPDAEKKSAAASADYPVKAVSCGFTSTVESKPRRAVTMNQGATEVALALGVQDQLAGTAYLDDAVPEKWRKAYDSVDVLSKEYPDHETLLAAKPDFVYGSYASAFDKDAAGPQSELAELGIGSMTSLFGCGENKPSQDVSFESVWDEIAMVGDVFGVPDRAEKIEADQEATLKTLKTLKADGAGAGVDVFWFDSGDKTAFAGAGEGGPQLILDAVGATNVFADLKGGWADVSWEKVVKAEPDVIVVADAGWSTADDKIAFLKKDPVLSTLDAVEQDRFVVIPFSESTPGVRLVDGAQHVAEQLTSLDLG